MVERGQPDQTRGYEPDNQNRSSEASFRGPDGRPREDSTETESDEGQEARRTANRGFAAMDPDKQKRIASEGGRAAHKQGVAHEWSKDEAREAGRKGGKIVSQDRSHMSEIGRKGGQNSGQRRQRTDEELL